LNNNSLVEESKEILSLNTTVETIPIHREKRREHRRNDHKFEFDPKYFKYIKKNSCSESGSHRIVYEAKEKNSLYKIKDKKDISSRSNLKKIY